MTRTLEPVVDSTATVADRAILSGLYHPLQGGGTRQASTRATRIGPRCWIGEGAFVGQGAEIGADSILHGDVRVECDATIGSGVLLTYRAWIDLEATVGDGSVIGGFVCERAVVGRRCRVFGSLAHLQHDPSLPWDDPRAQEESPVLKDEVFVGWGATIIGPVVLGERAYVCAGAIVSRPVPSRHIAHGHNQVVPYDRWPGALQKSPFFDE
jgi:acetyltransferase-like isoleucine patch superfamily enzyme